MVLLNLYNIFCIEENKIVSVWAETAPLLCPNNHSDRTLNNNATVIIRTLEEKNVKIEDTIQITDDQSDGYFRVLGNKVDIPESLPNNNTPIFDISFPYDVSIFSTSFLCNPDNKGDIINVYLAPDTDLGAVVGMPSLSYIQIDTLTNSNVFKVHSSLFSYLKNGYIIKIVQSGVTQELGEIISLNAVDNTITTVLSADKDYLSSLSAKILFSVHRIKNFYLPDITIEMGGKKIGGSLFKKGTIARIYYQNVSGLAKSITYLLELSIL